MICVDMILHQFAFDIGEQWGIGQGKFDNGVVVLVKPTGGQGNRKSFIAVGYGLEGVIPDLTAKHIVERELISNFRNGNFFKGLDEGTDVLMSLAIGEFNSDAYGKRAKKSAPWPLLIPILFVIFMMFILPIFRIRSYSRTNNVSFWVAMALMSQASRSHGGSYGGFSSGGGGFGGFGSGGSSGGFGGFGGGGFGGGGAGGSW